MKKIILTSLLLTIVFTSYQTVKAATPMEKPMTIRLVKCFVEKMDIIKDTCLREVASVEKDSVDVVETSTYREVQTPIDTLNPCPYAHENCDGNHTTCAYGHLDCTLDHTQCTQGHLDCTLDHTQCAQGHMDCDIDHSNCPQGHTNCDGNHQGQHFKNEAHQGSGNHQGNTHHWNR